MQRVPSLSSLRLFMMVAQSSSFSDTARAMGVSQPALSRTIRLLEEELSVRLFDRDTRNVNLTAAGEMLLPAVERLVGDFLATFSELEHALSGKRGRVVIGALPSVAANLLPLAMARFQMDYPEVEVIVRDSLSGTLYQQMRERQVDFSITTPPEQPEVFAFQPLMIDECVLVCADGDPLAQGGPASWSIFAERPFIAMAPSSSVRRLTDAALIRANVTAKPLFECAHLATVGGLIVAGLGISALPRTTLPLLSRVEIASVPLREPKATRTIGIAHLANRSLSPSAALLARHLSALEMEAETLKYIG
ncbi:DNA-binding transcriptional LysR family regulator [Hephaestia caeni]|uniref:DNA-binding transcriptional LysR family regulator n=1 Tax=Hephaestia caeni TaxID=645617 RepID=A0A397NLY2_9SPHN|nr:LysR family transcriptional regulator [Hephaestia caeni]RIA36599.1 DNA-binding transcriptional LysR family regulator [Hephaestia caeni]